jgi:hypothetical protein
MPGAGNFKRRFLAEASNLMICARQSLSAKGSPLPAATLSAPSVIGRFAVALDAASAVEPAGAADACKGTPESEHHGAKQSQQEHGMHSAWNQSEEPDQRENHSHADDAHARPHRRPDPLPKQDQPCNRYETLGLLATRFPILVFVVSAQASPEPDPAQ